MGYVASWYSRVVDVRSRAFDEGRWRRSSRWVQLDSRRGQLRSVELLSSAGQSSQAAEVGRVVGFSWTVVAGSWGRSRLVDRYPRLWRYIVVNQGMYRSSCWVVRQVVRESGVAVVEQSATASRYVDCVVPCKSVEVEERLGPCWAP